MKRISVAALVVLAVFSLAAGPSKPGVRDRARPIVVIDPGHGGPDFGAIGRHGLREKDLALVVARAIGAALKQREIDVVYTRERDDFVSLAERTAIANRTRAALFLSIHANSAPDAKVNGSETYFLSLDASDDEAMRVAMTENDVYKQEGTSPDGADIVGSILGDLIRTEHLRGSSQMASAIQHKLAGLPGGSRGVKQAPFVVLMGVNMPAALIEIGFLSSPDEERRLEQTAHQRAIARAVAEAIGGALSARESPPDVPAVEAGE